MGNTLDCMPIWARSLSKQPGCGGCWGRKLPSLSLSTADRGVWAPSFLAGCRCLGRTESELKGRCGLKGKWGMYGVYGCMYAGRRCGRIGNSIIHQLNNSISVRALPPLLCPIESITTPNWWPPHTNTCWYGDFAITLLTSYNRSLTLNTRHKLNIHERRGKATRRISRPKTLHSRWKGNWRRQQCHCQNWPFSFCPGGIIPI